MQIAMIQNSSLEPFRWTLTEQGWMVGAGTGLVGCGEKSSEACGGIGELVCVGEGKKGASNVRWVYIF